MFCPKCGSQNPDLGKFCRSCGTDLGNLTGALSAPLRPQTLVNHKGKPIHLEGAIAKLFSGMAFLIIAIALAVSGEGKGWWFWMLIPAFGALGSGVAQYMQLRRFKNDQVGYGAAATGNDLRGASNVALPPPQTEWVAPESRYKTGDLVPPSVTEHTTRHLDPDSEGKTKALPTK